MPPLREHHPALPYPDVPAALQRVRECTAETVTKPAFEFMVLTAARAGEVRGSEWSEVDLKTATWTVPAARMKARREHRVPLSDRALAILREAKGLGDGKGLIFPNKRSGKPITNMGLTRMLERLEISAVPHGFRSSFKDWTIEQTSTPWAVAEAALAHNLGNSTEIAYARSDLFAKRRLLMQQWDNFLSGGGETQ
jgi:integrase